MQTNFVRWRIREVGFWVVGLGGYVLQMLLGLLLGRLVEELAQSLVEFSVL